jgi:hypothetical protein
MVEENKTNEETHFLERKKKVIFVILVEKSQNTLKIMCQEIEQDCIFTRIFSLYTYFNS